MCVVGCAFEVPVDYNRAPGAFTGMWAWQGGGQGSEGPGASAANAAPGAAPGTAPGAPAVQGAPPQQQQHELSDMLQMLDQSGPGSFEDLNMFNTSFE